MFTVYMHRNKANDKKYIGITKQSPKRRWQNGYGYKTNTYFWRSIKKYGWDGFEHKILYRNLSEEEAKETEIQLIIEYNCKSPNGYNITRGGDNVSDKLHSEETRRKISKALKGRHLSDECKKKISKAVSGKNNYFYGKTFTPEHIEKLKIARSKRITSEETKEKMSKSRKGENSKIAISVYQYSLDGYLIRKWFSASLAAIELNINQANITSVCKGRRNECGGYMWRYYESEKIDAFAKRNYKKIIQKNKDGLVISTFNSISEASKKLNLDSSSITKCCKGKSQTCGGFRWEYA